MVEPQPSKRLRIDLIEKTNPQVSALFSTLVILSIAQNLFCARPVA
jgi:hypothetical protein